MKKQIDVPNAWTHKTHAIILPFMSEETCKKFYRKIRDELGLFGIIRELEENTQK